MSARVVAMMGADGRLVACKRSRDEEDAVRLRHEADVLRLASHPGVVELVGCETEGDAVVLTTEFAGPHSLETLGPVDVERAAGIIASLATTVADLHDLGVIHGRLDPSHVVIGSGGRPMLCGFAGGGRVGTVPPPGTPLTERCDPAASREATLTPHIDVYGLGCLLRALVAREHSDVEPIPDRRWRFDRFRPPWTGYHDRALLTLADRATDDVPSRRPPARRFAQDVLDTVPAAVLVHEAGHDDVPRGHSRARRASLLVLGCVLVIIGALAVRGGRSAAAPSVAPAVTTAPAPTASTAPATRSASTVATITPRSCPPVNGPVAEDLDGDGCGDSIRVEDDRVVVVGAQRFSAGQPGDRVAVGNWRCARTASVAVLRPSSGAVFVFDGWATAGTDVSVPPTAVAVDAVDLQTRDRGDGCTSLFAVRRDGTTEEVL